MDTESLDSLDRQDMARLCKGHDAALNELMSRHGRRLFHYLIRQLQDESEAEDLVQETFVRVFQHREKFDPKYRFSTWLYTIATNLARNHQRWRARHPEVSLEKQSGDAEVELKEKFPAPDLTPSQAMTGGELAQAVRAAIAQLPEDLRTALILFEYEEQSQQEIAAVMKCTPKAVEMRLYHARKQLKEVLANLL